MLGKAIEKIRSEMDQNKTNLYIQTVGGFLLQYLETIPSAAEKILTEGKTIAKSLDEMLKAAEKKKVGNCAVLVGQEGCDIVLKYFGLEAGVVKNEASPTIPVTAPGPEVKSAKSEMDFDIKLEDLL